MIAPYSDERSVNRILWLPVPTGNSNLGRMHLRSALERFNQERCAGLLNILRGVSRDVGEETSNKALGRVPSLFPRFSVQTEAPKPFHLGL